MQHGSCACNKSELDVSSVPPTMASMVEGQWTEHYPIVNPQKNTGPIEFNIPGETEKWTDINQSYLKLRIKITLNDDSDILADTNLSTVNNFFHSLFSSIDLYLNNKLIPCTDKYPYKAYMENLLGTSAECKLTILKDLEMFSLDKNGDIKKNTKANGGLGWLSRKTKITGKVFELIAKPHIDLFLQEKYLPNGIDIRLKFNRSPLDFCLMGSDATGKIEIQEAIYNIRSVKLRSDVANDQNKTILTHNMKIPIRRAEIKTFTITAGLQSRIEDNIFRGQLPKRIFVGMVLNSDMNGDPTTNPFNFQHFKLTKLNITLGGKSVYNKPFETDFTNADNKKTLQSYYSLLSAIGLNTNDFSNGMPLEEYENGNTLWGVDLTADQGSEEGHLHPIKQGVLTIEMAFSEALAHAVNVIIYAEYDNQIVINGRREIITDF